MATERGPGPGLRLALLGLLWSGATACGTVTLGDPPADVNACRPSQIFFVDRVWPEFLAQSYGGKTCADARCHDAASGNFLLVVPPDPSSIPTFPLTAGSDWDLLYLSAARQMSCTNVAGSELYTRPAGLRPHGGGKLLDPPEPVQLLLEMWVAASP